jgi:hypothetical protein
MNGVHSYKQRKNLEGIDTLQFVPGNVMSTYTQ